MKTQLEYDKAFGRELRSRYRVIDAYEERLAFKVDEGRLEAAARVLACPVKVNPPNWQHGRVIYATAMRYMMYQREPVVFLDIGTAKGFSACVMTWAIAASGRNHEVVSVDVMEPTDRVARNSVAELDGFKTIAEFVEPFIDPTVKTSFFGGGSLLWLREHHDHIGFAFVDGKHTYDMVMAEHEEISKRQQLGDIIVFDDLQIEPVHRAVSKLKGYDVLKLDTGAGRKYAIAFKQ